MHPTKISTLIAHASVIAAATTITTLSPDDMAPRGWESDRDYYLSKAKAAASAFRAKYGIGFKSVGATKTTPEVTAIPAWQAQRDKGKAKGLQAAAKWKAKYGGGGGCKNGKCNNHNRNKRVDYDHDHDHDHHKHDDDDKNVSPGPIDENNNNPVSQLGNSRSPSQYNGGPQAQGGDGDTVWGAYYPPPPPPPLGPPIPPVPAPPSGISASVPGDLPSGNSQSNANTNWQDVAASWEAYGSSVASQYHADNYKDWQTVVESAHSVASSYRVEYATPTPTPTTGYEGKLEVTEAAEQPKGTAGVGRLTPAPNQGQVNGAAAGGENAKVVGMGVVVLAVAVAIV